MWSSIELQKVECDLSLAFQSMFEVIENEMKVWLSFFLNIVQCFFLLTLFLFEQTSYLLSAMLPELTPLRQANSPAANSPTNNQRPTNYDIMNLIDGLSTEVYLKRYRGRFTKSPSYIPNALLSDPTTPVSDELKIANGIWERFRVLEYEFSLMGFPFVPSTESFSGSTEELKELLYSKEVN